MRLGIICGRFQIPNLHEAHEALINYVFANNDRVLIFIVLIILYHILIEKEKYQIL